MNPILFMEDIPYYIGKALNKSANCIGDFAYDAGDKLENSFANYHNRIVKTFDELPYDGKVMELVLRIITVAAAPILYPLLGIAYLANRMLNGKVCEFPSSDTRNISNQLAELKRAGLPGWQQESIALIRKSRYDYAPYEINRLRESGILTRDLNSRLDASINKVDSSISSSKRSQVKAVMAQALEIKSVYGDTHDVFIHAQGSKWMGLNFLVKELHKAFKPKTDTKHFKFLRAPCKLAEPGTASTLWKTFRNTLFGEENITNVREYVDSKWYVSDNDGETREHLLSVDGYFFNAQRYESSLFFLMNDDNILGKPDTIKYFYKQIIKHYQPHMSDSNVGRLANKVYNVSRTQGNLCGNLFAICVPKEISQDVQYRAHPYGVECKCHSKENNRTILSKLQKNILGHSSECKSGPSPIPQFRIFTPMLKPGVTPIYLLTPIEKSAKKAMKAGIQNIVREIKRS